MSTTTFSIGVDLPRKATPNSRLTFLNRVHTQFFDSFRRGREIGSFIGRYSIHHRGHSWPGELEAARAIKLSGEVAQSFYNPDTFSAEGENGVAMVDNMEGIDSVSGPSINQTSWLVSSAPVPVPVNLLGFSLTPTASSGPGNNRTRFYNGEHPKLSRPFSKLLELPTPQNSIILIKIL